MFRIIQSVINTVKDSPKLEVTCSKQTVKTFSVLRGLDFISLGIAYSGNIVGINQTALKHIGIFFKFKLVRSKDGIR